MKSRTRLPEGTSKSGLDAIVTASAYPVEATAERTRAAETSRSPRSVSWYRPLTGRRRMVSVLRSWGSKRVCKLRAEQGPRDRRKPPSSGVSRNSSRVGVDPVGSPQAQRAYRSRLEAADPLAGPRPGGLQRGGRTRKGPQGA